MALQKSLRHIAPAHIFSRSGALCTLVCMFCFTAAGRARTQLPPLQPVSLLLETPVLEQSPVITSPQAAEVIPALEYYPTDSLFTCAQRQAYQTGDLLLEVPRLNLSVPVQNGTDDDALLHGVGLYEVSPLPGTGNANVSIAGHRGTAGFEFYNIDKLCDGDVIYLTYHGWRYTYLWDETLVVEPDDWSTIFCTDTSSVTLTSCYPKTGNSHRICAIGTLVSVEAIE